MKKFVDNGEGERLVEDLSRNENPLFPKGSVQFKDGYAFDPSDISAGLRTAALDTNLTINTYASDYTFSAKVMTKTNYIQTLFASRDTNSFHIYNSG